MRSELRSCGNPACHRLTRYLGGVSRFCCGPCASAYKDSVEVYKHLGECDTLAQDRERDRRDVGV